MDEATDRLRAAWAFPLSLAGAKRLAVERAATESRSRRDAAQILGCSEKHTWFLMRKYRVRACWTRAK